MFLNVRHEQGAWCSFVLLLVTITWLAWASGGKDLGSFQLVQGALGVGGLSIILVFWKTKRGKVSTYLAWMLLAAALLVFMLIQAFNPSHVFDEVTRYLEPLDHLGWLPASVDRAATLNVAAWFFCCVLAFALARFFLPANTWPGRLLLVGLVAVAAVLSLMVISQRISPRPFPVFPVTGRFAYENHFAAFANMALPIALCLGIHFQRNAQEKNERSHPGYLFYGVGVLIATAVFYSRSRAGMLVSVGMIGLMVVSIVVSIKSWRPSKRMNQIYIAGVLVATLGLTAWIGREPIRKELQTVPNLSNELTFRKKIATSTLDAFATRKVAGLGAGTYAMAFPFYQDPSLNGFFRHAHCDPVELLAEFGVVGSLLALLFAMAILLPVCRNQHPARSIKLSRDWLRLGVMISLAGLMAHALIDFPFRLPVITLSAFVLAGMMYAWEPKKTRRKRGATS